MKFTKKQLQNFIEFSVEDYADDLGYQMSTSMGDCREIIRLALIGWQVERAKEVAHKNHCDGGDFCNWKEAHNEVCYANNRG